MLIKHVSVDFCDFLQQKELFLHLLVGSGSGNCAFCLFKEHQLRDKTHQVWYQLSTKVTKKIHRVRNRFTNFLTAFYQHQPTRMLLFQEVISPKKWMHYLENISPQRSQTFHPPPPPRLGVFFLRQNSSVFSSVVWLLKPIMSHNQAEWSCEKL